MIELFYGDDMELKYDDKSIYLIECKSFFSRLIDFMFKKKINYALLFNKCNSIHTFFMKSNIDVIMCNKDNKILYYYNNFKKNKIIWPKKNVSKVIELPVDYFDIKIGNEIKFKMNN